MALEPLAATDPQDDAEQETLQVTELVPGSKFTEATKTVEPLTCTVEVAGEIETEIALTVMVAEPDFVGSLAAVAVIVTLRSLDGEVLGAVYVVVRPVVGETLPQADAEQETLQAIPVLSLVTTVVRTAVPAVRTEVTLADTEMPSGVPEPLEQPQSRHATMLKAASAMPF
ncbi:MAG TPA: hypothetical protein VMJ35_14075 [Dongiaceae bacterium]|nr:hypothetical protein [Dongiaceae bacterium]